MLPQMMPMPWVMVFFCLFFYYFSVMSFLSCFYGWKVDEGVGSKSVSKSGVEMPW